MADELLKDVIASGDATRIEKKLAELLQNAGTGSGNITVASAQLCVAALQRLAIERLEKSSKHLEWLTWALVILTIVLLIVAIPPFFETLKRLGCF